MEKGPRVSERNADINKHCQMKLHRTICIWILTTKLDFFFFFLSLNPRLFPGFSFFLNFPCGMMSPPIWHPKILPYIVMGSPDSPSIQPVQCLYLCLTEPGLRNTGQSALSSPHQVILLCSWFSVYLWFWRSEAVWGSFVLDLFSISLEASLSELISILIS